MDFSSFFSRHTFQFAVLTSSFLFLAFTGLRAGAETYYSKNSGDANQYTNWGLNTDGTGTSPNDFSTEGDVFILTTGSSLGLNAHWIIGPGVTLQVDGYLRVAGSNHDIIINGTVVFTKTGVSQFTVIGGGYGNDFTLGPDATLKTANLMGIMGPNCSLLPTASGTITLPTSANYELNGPTQATLGLPNTVNNLTCSGSGTKTLTGALTVNGTLTINSNVTLATLYHSLNFLGDFANNGTLSGASNIEISGTATQNIGSFSTTGTVSMTKTGGIATLEGNINGTGLTINGSGGMLHLGAGLTHTFTGTWTSTVGTLDGGSSTLKVGGRISSTEGIFIPGTGTVEYNNMSIQQVFPGNHHHLILSGGGPKSLQPGTTSITGNLTLNGTAITATASGLTIGGNLTIGNGTTFTAAGYPLTVRGTTTVGGGTSGNLTISSAVGAKVFSGLVTIEPGGSWSNNTTYYSHVNFAGGITNKGTFNAGSGVHTFITNEQSLSGTLSIGSITITGITVTNNNTLTVGTELTGTGGLIQAANAILNIGGTSSITTLTASAPNNTVNFNKSGIQSIPGFTYSNLTTSGTGTKTIAPGTAVTVNGTLATNGLLVINSDATHSGSLIVNGICSGPVTYNRWLNHANTNPITNPSYSRWYITSPPVAATGFNNTTNANKIHVDASSTLYDFATYSESENDWKYDYSSTSATNLPGTLTPGQGYLISLKPASDGIIQFKGALNNGTVPKSVTANIGNGWNAVGNPYTSAIGITGSGGFLDVNTLSGMLSPAYAAIYIWNEDEGGYTGNEQYYKVIGNSGYNYTPQNAGGHPISGPNIQAGQGFMIKANTGGTISFTKAMQVHEPELDLKSNKVSWPGMTLLAESHGQIRSTVVAFNGQMTTGLDVSYDVGLLASDDFQVYTHLMDRNNPVDFAIQCLPDKDYTQLCVPVGVDLPEGGDLVFKVSGIILPEGLYPVIEDKELDIKTAFKRESDSYIVALHKNTSGTGRFYLSVEGIALSKRTIQHERKLMASLVNNCLVIHGLVELGTRALLFDICGRKVGEYSLLNTNRNEIAVSSLNQGVYLLKIQDRHYSQSIKLIAVNTNF